LLAQCRLGNYGVSPAAFQAQDRDRLGIAKVTVGRNTLA
jgi:hypothetical protein